MKDVKKLLVVLLTVLCAVNVGATPELEERDDVGYGFIGGYTMITDQHLAWDLVNQQYVLTMSMMTSSGAEDTAQWTSVLLGKSYFSVVNYGKTKLKKAHAKAVNKIIGVNVNYGYGSYVVLAKQTKKTMLTVVTPKATTFVDGDEGQPVDIVLMPVRIKTKLSADGQTVVSYTVQGVKMSLGQFKQYMKANGRFYFTGVGTRLGLC